MVLRIAATLLAATSVFAAVDPRSVTIYRDTWGVPHIYAKTDAGAAFGLMYAQAEDNFWQLETDYIRALGRSAEVEGVRGISGDILYRAYEVEKRAKEAYAQADPKLRALCDAFAAGVNRYLDTHQQTHSRLLTRWEPWWILADEMRGPAGSGITQAERARAFPAITGTSAPTETGNEGDEGSNMWAIAPSRSATGHAMLLINPHIGFFGGGQRYEAHLHSGEGLDVSGFAIMGTPYIRSGHNRDLGWSHTNNYAQTADVYLEKFDDPADPLSYRYGNEHRRATQWTDEIRVQTGAGFEVRRVTFRKTHHGPILGIRGNDGLAVRGAAVGGGVMAQRWAMGRARNLREFQAALARRVLVGSNTIYADRAGNIWYLHGDAIPHRSIKFDWTKAVDGSDPETEWQGLHSISELPQVLNPKSGWLQNCNSTPFLTTEGADNLERAKFPAYMAPEPETPRATRSRALLSGSRKFSFEEWAAAGMDTKVGLAERQVPEMVAAFEKLRQADPARAAGIAELIAELQRWDQVARIDSVAATLFIRSANATDPLAALEKTKAALESAWGTWRVAWGEVNRLQRVHTSGTEEPFRDDRPSVPVPGAPSFSGTVFTFGAREVPGQKRWYGTVGDTYVAVVDFGKKIKARSLLVMGQIADPASRHYFDQAKLYSEGRFKEAWFTSGEIRRHLERTYHP
jgi:acyl-homoserine-lactone acylase